MKKRFRRGLMMLLVAGVLHAMQDPLPMPITKVMALTQAQADTLICPRHYVSVAVYPPHQEPMQVLVQEEGLPSFPHQPVGRHPHPEHLSFVADTEKADFLPPHTIYTCQKEEPEWHTMPSGKRG